MRVSRVAPRHAVTSRPAHSASRLRRRARIGFTLLEMIVAVAIFVGSVAILSRLVLIGVENAEYARLQAQAALIAENRFNELEAGILTIDDAGTTMDADYPEWEWTLTATAGDLTGLYVVTIEVRNVQRQSAQGYVYRVNRLWFEETEIAQ